MRKKHKHYGFSLTEVLLAVGTLSIGMIFVAGVFPVAIHFSTIASERTIAAVVTDEAFAKVRLYGQAYSELQRQTQPGLPDWVEAMPPDSCVDFNDLVLIISRNEFAYPSYDNAGILQSRYCWSALCRRVGDTHLVQVTVFVSRKIGSGARYRDPDEPINGRVSYPMPVRIGVSGSAGSDVLTINDAAQTTFINDDYTIVDDQTGRLYRVLERDASQPDTIVLDRPWQGGNWVWVIPPPADGGRYPCIAAYQKVIGF